MSLSHSQFIFPNLANREGLFELGEGEEKKAEQKLEQNYDLEEECNAKWRMAFNRLSTVSKQPLRVNQPLAYKELINQAKHFGYVFIEELRAAEKISGDLFREFHRQIENIEAFSRYSTEGDLAHRLVQREQLYKIRQLVLYAYENTLPNQRERSLAYSVLTKVIEKEISDNSDKTAEEKGHYSDVAPTPENLNPELLRRPKEDVINKTYASLLQITRQYCATHANSVSTQNKMAIFNKLLTTLEDRQEEDIYERMKNFVQVLNFADKGILNQHRHPAGVRYLANVLSILLVLPALYRALHRYHQYGTARFWQPESKNMKDYVIRECEQINVRAP